MSGLSNPELIEQMRNQLAKVRAKQAENAELLAKLQQDNDEAPADRPQTSARDDEFDDYDDEPMGSIFRVEP